VAVAARISAVGKRFVVLAHLLTAAGVSVDKNAALSRY